MILSIEKSIASLMVTQQHMRVAFIIPGKSKRIDVRNLILDTYNEFPKWWRPLLTTNNQSKLVTASNNIILFVDSLDYLRGLSLNIAIVDSTIIEEARQFLTYSFIQILEYKTR
jgi:hypothetical protein